METKGFIVACREYFGLHPGQSLLEFRDEIRRLLQADRDELAPLLEKELGYKVTSRTTI